MNLFDEVKEEVKHVDLCTKEWTCLGVTYKIPLMNGDIESQSEFLEIADKYDKGASGKPSELANVLGEFMYKLLKMANPILEDDARRIATLPNCKKVFNIWLGNEE